ncbi:hypothetical protein PR048_031461 [Dryococelus australis]|uniref:Uncharacterized protein n=1 Tax=Dryococelus australis TaxID=614101 RepID=A0ABQ9G8D3_9NEOP|nr:hypothetical protein PR048_031461 [Dryococelus australis]
MSAMCGNTAALTRSTFSCVRADFTLPPGFHVCNRRCSAKLTHPVRGGVTFGHPPMSYSIEILRKQSLCGDNRIVMFEIRLQCETRCVQMTTAPCLPTMASHAGQVCPYHAIPILGTHEYWASQIGRNVGDPGLPDKSPAGHKRGVGRGRNIRRGKMITQVRVGSKTNPLAHPLPIGGRSPIPRGRQGESNAISSGDKALALAPATRELFVPHRAEMAGFTAAEGRDGNGGRGGGLGPGGRSNGVPTLVINLLSKPSLRPQTTDSNFATTFSSMEEPRWLSVGNVPDDATGRRVFSGISHFPQPCIRALLHTHLASRSSALKTSLLRATQISSLTHSFIHSSMKLRAALNIEVLKPDQGDARCEWSYAVVARVGRERETPEETRRPVTSPARLSRAKIRERPRQESNPRFALVAGELYSHHTTDPAYLGFYPAFETEKHGSDKVDSATRIACPIAAKRKVPSWRTVFSSHWVYLREFQRRPYNLIDGKSSEAVLSRKAVSGTPSCILMASFRRKSTDRPRTKCCQVLYSFWWRNCPKYRAAARGAPLAIH